MEALRIEPTDSSLPTYNCHLPLPGTSRCQHQNTTSFCAHSFQETSEHTVKPAVCRIPRGGLEWWIGIVSLYPPLPLFSLCPFPSSPEDNCSIWWLTMCQACYKLSPLIFPTILWRRWLYSSFFSFFFFQQRRSWGSEPCQLRLRGHMTSKQIKIPAWVCLTSEPILLTIAKYCLSNKANQLWRNVYLKGKKWGGDYPWNI